jgi:hypothetical protein
MAEVSLETLAGLTGRSKSDRRFGLLHDPVTAL